LIIARGDSGEMIQMINDLFMVGFTVIDVIHGAELYQSV
jgi:hypothetical protein